MGPASKQQALEERPRSIRALFGLDGTRNATHGSDSLASAAREISFFFNLGTAAAAAAGPADLLASRRDALAPLTSSLSSPQPLGPAGAASMLSPVKAPTALVSPTKQKNRRNRPPQALPAINISNADMALMEAYASTEVTPLLNSITRGLVLNRPADAADYVIRELTLQKQKKGPN